MDQKSSLLVECRQPRVSVVMPVFNGQDFVGRAIKSVFAQTFQSFELIVVDDASRDRTRDVLASFPDPRLIIVSLMHNVGPALARNRGLNEAKGEYVAFIDADDEWLPDKLECQLRVMQSDAEVSLVSSNGVEVYPDGRRLRLLDTHPESWNCGWKDLLRESQIATPTVLTRRALLDACGGFDENLVVAEDQDLWIKLALKGRLKWVDQSLVIVHKRVDSYNALREEHEIEDVLRTIEKHLKQQASCLTSQEIRSIRSHRYGQFARNAFERGAVRQALRLFYRRFTVEPRSIIDTGIYLLAQARRKVLNG